MGKPLLFLYNYQHYNQLIQSCNSGCLPIELSIGNLQLITHIIRIWFPDLCLIWKRYIDQQSQTRRRHYYSNKLVILYNMRKKIGWFSARVAVAKKTTTLQLGNDCSCCLFIIYLEWSIWRSAVVQLIKIHPTFT